MSTATDIVTAGSTVADLLRARAGDTAIGIIAGDRRLTWRDTVARSRATAGQLTGMRRSGPFHVGLLMDNTPDYLIGLFGITIAGAVAVGVNNTRRGDELGTDIRHTDCQLVLTDAANAPLLTDLDLADARVCLVDAPDWRTSLSDTRTPSEDADVQASDLFTLVFTSGSTGAPKAVQMTHGRAFDLASRWSVLSPDDVAYCAIPLFHTNALTSMALPALATGAAIALRERFSASQFMPDIRRYGATFFSTAGRALAYVLDVPATPEDRDHKVKFGLAAEASPSDVEQFDARFGIRCFGGYASSENAITLARAPGMPDDALGVAQSDADVAIIDPESGIECPRAALSPGGELLNSDVAIGEIVGRNVADRFEGYYKNPDATEARRRGGWFWSGDLGYRDADGVFFFAGRTDDSLRVDSENFAAAPVERVLARFPGARGVAVFAVPDERTADDQVMAALEMVDGVRFDPGELTVFLDAQPDLGTKWSPRYVRITTLPVGATNKVDKPTLRRERWYTDDPVYWRSGRSRAYVPFTPDDRHALEARFQQHGRSVYRR